MRWYASGGGVGRAGPYPSAAAAARSLIGLDGYPISGAFVWPEEEEEEEEEDMNKYAATVTEEGAA